MRRKVSVLASSCLQWYRAEGGPVLASRLLSVQIWGRRTGGSWGHVFPFSACPHLLSHLSWSWGALRQLIDTGRSQRFSDEALWSDVWRVALSMCFPLPKYCLLWSAKGIPCSFPVLRGEQVIDCRGTEWCTNDSLSRCTCAAGLSVGWQVARGYAVQLFWRQVQRAIQWGKKCCVETVSLGNIWVRSSQLCILWWLDHIVHLFGVMPDLFGVSWMLWTSCMFSL